MKIIATTEEGFLIEATPEEVRSILKATTGQKDIKLEVGTKIPAHDYAEVIRACKAFKTNYEYVQLKTFISRFNKESERLISSVESLNFNPK